MDERRMESRRQSYALRDSCAWNFRVRPDLRLSDKISVTVVTMVAAIRKATRDASICIARVNALAAANRRAQEKRKRASLSSYPHADLVLLPLPRSSMPVRIAPNL
ncbi:hypothetical protein GGS26DRAFT_597085 [Hypomontagnella submonticulosa]|nr:hypothetical protein GGS26DRAFT_597085 [Hypomontagnella submonticulosa]